MNNLFGFDLSSKVFLSRDYKSNKKTRWFIRAQLNAAFVHSLISMNNERKLNGCDINTIKSSGASG
jgi:hypothetical protein